MINMLSDNAKKILTDAAKGKDGIIIEIITHGDGYGISSSGCAIVEGAVSTKEKIAWQEAISELENEGYIECNDKKTGRYCNLTSKGWDAGESL